MIRPGQSGKRMIVFRQGVRIARSLFSSVMKDIGSQG